MGNYISAYNSDTYITGARIGTNGSMMCFQALLLAAYGGGKFPESDRVRKRWIRQIPTSAPGTYPLSWPLSELGFPYTPEMTRAQLAQLIGFNRDDQCWLAVSEESISLGRKFKPITCPMLQSIIWILDGENTDYSYAQIEGEAVRAFAAHYATLLPLLIASCWHTQLVEYQGVIAAATAAENPRLTIS